MAKERGQRRLAEVAASSEVGVEPSLLLNGELLVLLFRDKSTENLFMNKSTEKNNKNNHHYK